MSNPHPIHLLVVAPRIVRTACGERVEALCGGTLASVIGRDAKLNVTDDARKITCRDCQRKIFMYQPQGDDHGKSQEGEVASAR